MTKNKQPQNTAIDLSDDELELVAGGLMEHEGIYTADAKRTNNRRNMITLPDAQEFSKTNSKK